MCVSVVLYPTILVGLNSCTVVHVAGNDCVSTKYYPGIVFIKSDKSIAYKMNSFGVSVSKSQLQIGATSENAVINPKNNQAFFFHKKPSINN